MDFEKLVDLDRENIIHPYTSPTNPLHCIPIISADGVRLKMADNRELIDGMASWWCMIHGYNHPVLNSAVEKQLHKMSHVMFGGITHPQAVNLSQKLVDITSDNLQKVFFCDSGSVAVEVAIKMALQYWYAKGMCRKNRLLTIRNGYHGDTFGAMSVCDPITGMHHLFSEVLTKQFFADSPQSRTDENWTDNDIESFRKIIDENHSKIAAVILEPIVQGAGGMRFYAPEYLRQVRKLCNTYNVLLIFDEIATGFGRTGKLFAYEHADVEPDILCLGKAITGGYMSFAATLTNHDVCEGIGKNEGVFMHGPTFMANPLACSVANASINLLLSQNFEKTIQDISEALKLGFSPCTSMKNVADVRVLGGIGVIEMKKNVNVAEAQKEFVKRGVWVRPFGKLVYIMPPYIIDREDLDFLTRQIVDVVAIL